MGEERLDSFVSGRIIQVNLPAGVHVILCRLNLEGGSSVAGSGSSGDRVGSLHPHWSSGEGIVSCCYVTTHGVV